MSKKNSKVGDHEVKKAQLHEAKAFILRNELKGISAQQVLNFLKDDPDDDDVAEMIAEAMQTEDEVAEVKIAKLRQRVKSTLERLNKNDKALAEAEAQLKPLEKKQNEIREKAAAKVKARHVGLGFGSLAGGKKENGFDTKILQYPSTTSTGGFNAAGSEGHYIVFYINASPGPQAGAVELLKARAKREFLLQTRDRDRGEGKNEVSQRFDGAVETAQTKFQQSRKNRRLIDGLQPNAKPALTGDKGDSLFGQSGLITNSVRLPGAICLYMPNQVQANYQLNYADDEAGSLAMGLADVFRGLSGGEASMTGGQVTRMAQGATLKALETAAPGATNALSIQSGRILNNKMELAFKGIGRRKFNFTFTFTPHDRSEAKIIDTIIQRFKFHSHPEFIEGTKGMMMTIPDSFDIQYMYQSQENSFLNRISTCFLTSISVQYGGDRFTAHESAENFAGASGAPPTKTILTMEFSEIETITRERVAEGY